MLPVAQASTAYSGTGSSKTTAAISVQAGDLLVAVAGGSDGTTLGTPTNSGTPLSWTLQKSYAAGTSWGTAYAWTAVSTITGSTTVTFNRGTAGSPGTNFGGTVYVYRGGSVGSSQVGNGSGVPQLSLTVLQGSAVVFAATDFNPASGTATWLSVNGAQPSKDIDTTANNRFYAGRWDDAGAGGAKTVGLSAPTGQKWSAVALEVRAVQMVGGSDIILWDVAAPVGGSDTVRWDVQTVMVGGSDALAWDTASTVGGSDTVAWDGAWLGTWRELVHTPEWRAMMESTHRTISARAELVAQDGNAVRDLPFKTASVDFRGESAEQWAGSVEFADPELAPKTPYDPLDPRSGYRVRFWWQCHHDGAVFEVPVGTFVLDDPKVTDSGSGVSVSASARDILTVVRRTGYGETLVSVGGLTVDQALKRLFAAIAPWAQLSVPATDIALPSTYQLGLDNADPAQDWTKIASLAGWVVRTDRMGVITAGPDAERAGIITDWQEGPGCPVTSLDRGVSNSNIKNRVLVRSTNQEAVGVYAVAEDNDPGSPTWVGRYGPFTMVIESDAIKTEAAALNMARMQLGSHLRPSESVQVTVPQRPDLEYRDQIALARVDAGVSGTYRVSGWSLRLGPGDAAPQTMTVSMMARTTA